MWRSVFLHEFLDGDIGNFQAIAGTPTPGSLALIPLPTSPIEANSVLITPGRGFEYSLQEPLDRVIGVSGRVRFRYPIQGLALPVRILQVGDAELRIRGPLDPGFTPAGLAHPARALLRIGQTEIPLGVIMLPHRQFVDLRFDWHTSGQARLLFNQDLVGYHPDVDADAVMTHGASFRRSDQFFGSRETLSGGNVPAAGDPFVPRATDGDAAQITVVASFKGLLETLKYELLVEDADDYPPDGLRGGFDIAGSLLSPPSGSPSLLLPEERRKILLAMIAAVEAGEDATLPELPPGWKLNKGAWDAVTRYAFLEYECYYAYNDFDRVQTTPFENEHEGDNEGCCLVFDRNVINIAAVGEDPDQLLRAVPNFLITSVHEEFQDADLFLSIPPPIPPADDPGRLPRDDMELVVYVAWGSHATYLTPGDHDLVDFGDTFGLVGEKAPIVLALAPAAVLALALIISIIDHFVDTEDKTSEDGIHTGPPDVVADDPAAVASALLALPMSAEDHIYQPRHETLLREHAFPGKWGAHDGSIDKSPRYEPKTGRYFRKLLSSL